MIEHENQKFLFIWKIHNYSLFLMENGVHINSPTFKAESLGGSEWLLMLFPRGCTLEENGYVSCYLHKIKKDVEKTLYKLKIFDGDNKCIDYVENIELFDEYGRNTEKCIDCDDLNEKMKTWKTDILSIHCEITNDSESTKQPTQTVEARTTIDKTRYCFDWNVKFSDGSIKDHSRNAFVKKNAHFEFFLTMKNEEIKIIVSRLNKEISSESVYVSCKISLLNDNGIEIVSKTAKHLFLEKNSEIFNFPSFFSKMDLLDKTKKLIRNDTFTLKCEVFATMGEIFSEIKRVKFNVHTKPAENSTLALQDDLRKMLESQKHSDVKLRVSSIAIPAHKIILSSRSRVFSAMFDQNMLENETGTVDIQDLDVETLKLLLEFIYTGFVKDMEFAKAMKLLFAADKYQIQSLIEMCVDLIKSELSFENVCDVYTTADMISHKKLKLCALDFIETHSGTVLSTDTWSVWMEENVKLANEILFKLAISTD